MQQANKTGGLPQSGAVLGVDVGFSKKRSTTGLCLLSWDADQFEFQFECASTPELDRRRTLRGLVADTPLLSVAIDGPLGNKLASVANYRAAEALLSQGVMQQRGKPGQTSSPLGRQLHHHATELAKIVLEETSVGPSCHHGAIHEKCVVEAFPNIFLAAGISEKDLPPRTKRDASDRFWRVAANESTRLQDLLDLLLPGRRCALGNRLPERGRHEDKAAFACALTALSVVAGTHIGVGDPEEGYILLPPVGWWGSSENALPWLGSVLQHSLAVVRSRKSPNPNHRNAHLIGHDGECL